MATKLIIDGNAVYEIDEACLEAQRKKNEFQRRGKSQEAEKQEQQKKAKQQR